MAAGPAPPHPLDLRAAGRPGRRSEDSPASPPRRLTDSSSHGVGPRSPSAPAMQSIDDPSLLASKPQLESTRSRAHSGADATTTQSGQQARHSGPRAPEMQPVPPAFAPLLVYRGEHARTRLGWTACAAASLVTTKPWGHPQRTAAVATPLTGIEAQSGMPREPRSGRSLTPGGTARRSRPNDWRRATTRRVSRRCRWKPPTSSGPTARRPNRRIPNSGAESRRTVIQLQRLANTGNATPGRTEAFGSWAGDQGWRYTGIERDRWDATALRGDEQTAARQPQRQVGTKAYAGVTRTLNASRRLRHRPSARSSLPTRSRQRRGAPPA